VYLIGKIKNGEASKLIDKWTVSAFIKKGVLINKLKVLCQGSQLSFYCNGNLLVNITDYSLSGGKVALFTSKDKDGHYDAEVICDNFKISVP